MNENTPTPLALADSAIDWIQYGPNKPPVSEYPYTVYLVWVVQQWEGATGSPQLLQFSNKDNEWVPLPRGRTGAPQVVTHFSHALDVLGAPFPKPYGPRGKGLDVS